jgi:hypothetical protein
VVLASDASVLRLALVVAVASGCAFEVRAIRVGDVADTDVPIAPLDTLVDVAEAAVDASVDGAALPDADAMAGIDADDAPLPPDFADGSVPDVGVEVTVDLGVDAPSCARPRALCGGSCVDVRASERHCGACDHACPLGDSCVSGTCLAPGSSRAGGLCTRPAPRGGNDPVACTAAFGCFPTVTTAACTRDCVDSALQGTERSMCGGPNATCLTSGTGPDTFSVCATACAPGAASGAPGSCRAGFVCTGWWFTRADFRSDTPGCAPFCSRDADCYPGERCNSRVGVCDIPLPNNARVPDGAPCNPTIQEIPPGEIDPRNTQCRGECFPVSETVASQGICGSYVNVAERPTCPDEPDVILPDTGPDADNLGVCLYRLCRANAECRGALVCRYDEGADGRPDLRGPTWCMYPTAAQPRGLP